MMKAIENALFIAENDTRRRKSAPTLRQIESRLMKNILGNSLALEIIRNSQKPTSELIAELIEIEARVGEFVGETLQQTAAKHKGKIDLKGALAGALSFMPIRAPLRKQLKEMSLRKIALTWVKAALEKEQLKEEQSRAASQERAVLSVKTPPTSLPTPLTKLKSKKIATSKASSKKTKKKILKKKTRRK